MTRERDAHRVADDLESLRNGELSEAAFRAKWQGVAVPELLNVIRPNLEHYLADLDTRKRDPDYRAMQDAEMDKLVQLLRTGAPNAELAAVHFIGYS